MGHYKSNLRDIEFNLFEVLRRQEILGTDAYPDLDEETVRDILGEVDRLASGPLAESFADGDRHPPVFDPATDSGPHKCPTRRGGRWTAEYDNISVMNAERVWIDHNTFSDDPRLAARPAHASFGSALVLDIPAGTHGLELTTVELANAPFDQSDGLPGPWRPTPHMIS